MYTLKNKTAIQFFDNNKHLNFDTMVSLFVNIMENLKTNLSDKMENAHNSILIKEISEKLSKLEESNHKQSQFIEKIDSKLSDMSTQVYNHMNGLISSQLDSLTNNVRDIIKSNNGDSQKNILETINNNNSLFIKKIELLAKDPELKDKFVEEISRINNTITSETGRVIESYKSSDQGQMLSHVNSIIKSNYETLDNNIQNKIQTFFSTNSTMYTSLLGKIQESNDNIDLVSTYFQKQTGSNLKGKQGESKFEVVLSKHFPSSNITNTSGQKSSGDFILERQDKNKILIDTKDYETIIPVKEVEKILRDMELHNCNAILVSQYSGIAQKKDFEININNNNIIIFIHDANYDGNKIVLATNIIDHLEPILLANSSKEDESISSVELLQINKEYQELAANKLNIIQSIKKSQQDLILQIQKIDMPALTSYLNNKYANTGKTGFLCEYCKTFNAKNAKALASHQRSCKLKCKDNIVIDTK